MFLNQLGKKWYPYGMINNDGSYYDSAIRSPGHEGECL